MMFIFVIIHVHLVKKMSHNKSKTLIYVGCLTCDYPYVTFSNDKGMMEINVRDILEPSSKIKWDIYVKLESIYGLYFLFLSKKN